MKILFEVEAEEMETNIGIAKALIETKNLSVSDLREISRYLAVYCDEHLFDTIPNEHLCAPNKGGVE